LLIRDLIACAFPDRLCLFVSSDATSIRTGKEWFLQIKGALQKADAIIVLCSPKSVYRPWICFEAGAGWIRSLDVFPVCHSGMKPGALPYPLNELQACRGSDLRDRVFPSLAKLAQAEPQPVEYKAFLEQAKWLEGGYEFWNECNRCLSVIAKMTPRILDALSEGKPYRITEISISGAEQIRSVINFLGEQQVLKIEQTGMALPQNTCDFTITPLSQFGLIFSSPRLQISACD
jgi:hypothetical protein